MSHSNSSSSEQMHEALTSSLFDFRLQDNRAISDAVLVSMWTHFQVSRVVISQKDCALRMH